MAEKLNYQTLRGSGYDGYILEQAPVKVLQFGLGNFLRGFADYWFDMANEKAGFNGKAAALQPIPTGPARALNAQEGLYTLYLRGSENGKTISRKRVISFVGESYNPYEGDGWNQVIAIARSPELEYIVSNTTEAGIVYDPTVTFDQAPPTSFPGKLTVLLYERYKANAGGLAILSCELIDNNGEELENCVLHHARDWKLGDGFIGWLKKECLFCSTLVDRIVPGRIRDPQEIEKITAENGYQDDMAVVGEVFGVWYIEGPRELEDRLPFRRAGVNVHVVPDVSPYKMRKVRILNGAHTGFVPGAWLAGFNIVRDCMHDDTIRGFMNKILFDEVIPILPLDKKDCEDFAAAVADRFSNPFIDHQLLSISLNSTSKWKVRDLSSLLDYYGKFHRLPAALCMGFAAYIAFYSTDIRRMEDGAMICRRPAGDEYRVSDDAWVLDFYYAHKDADDAALVHDVLSNTGMWDQDLTKIEGLEDTVAKDLALVRGKGAKAAYASVL